MPRRPPTPPSFSPPLPSDQYLVYLISPHGSNNWTCKDIKGEERLAEVSSKLRRIKSLIVMRGDFAIISLFPQNPNEDKNGRLVGEIIHILDKSDIREWKKAGAWPEGFGEKPAPPPKENQDSDSDNENDSEEDDDENDEEDQS